MDPVSRIADADAHSEADTDAGGNPRSALSTDDRAALRACVADIHFDAPMSRRTTLRIGGPADALALPASVDELQAVVRACVSRGIPLLAIGAGSNLLVRDGGVRGVVLGTRNMRGLRREGDTGIWVECGVSTGKLLSRATEWQLGGLEFLGGVPGSVGGGMRMNAGTYLGEFKDVTSSVTTVRLRDAAVRERAAAECGFAYRHSAIPTDEVVVAARLSLTPRPRAEIESDVRGLRQRRKEREPAKVSNAGSTFKNPPGDYAGRLIEACGLKGTRVGGAECSPAHANWLVNTGTATAADLLQLIERVRDQVRASFGITLEMEVKVIGED
ncbi:UDP-N-acetylmuramate dehydrogenase [Haliangium ochraceum]|uniref:UDP-N-acetylenolpyruvoylglucosamine reductase n=1 Tax=Haliangium ochraceum (strain DSM 14365 / JCM 11303 / SMP-2) TaxID=502025 RepID=D0LIX1_HALO1|nr:UDP-N-acetylmuramate dehydrogenase [Haliangium ochraceum]ACY13000.1 UDP-N-acetylenolpyruvoylglucosamine reductase [Haliangium ochraceum DSM 14365]